jgi:hypothetical protein
MHGGKEVGYERRGTRFCSFCDHSHEREKLPYGDAKDAVVVWRRTVDRSCRALRCKSRFAEIVVAAPDQDPPQCQSKSSRRSSYRGPSTAYFTGSARQARHLVLSLRANVPLNVFPVDTLVGNALLGRAISAAPRVRPSLPSDRAFKRAAQAPRASADFLYDNVRTCKVQEDEIRGIDSRGLEFFRRRKCGTDIGASGSISHRRHEIHGRTARFFHIAFSCACFRTMFSFRVMTGRRSSMIA